MQTTDLLILLLSLWRKQSRRQSKCNNRAIARQASAEQSRTVGMVSMFKKTKKIGLESLVKRGMDFRMNTKITFLQEEELHPSISSEFEIFYTISRSKPGYKNN